MPTPSPGITSFPGSGPLAPAHRRREVGPALRAVKGHPMAKAAVEMAVLDAELSSGAGRWPPTWARSTLSVPSGVSVGIMASIPELLDAVGCYLEQGYVRIKLKIEPGWDFEPVRAVRERFGDEIALQVDANTAYSLSDARRSGPAGSVRAAADRTAPGRGRHCRPRRPGRPDPHSGLPRRIHHLRFGRGRCHPPGCLFHRQHQSRRG